MIYLEFVSIDNRLAAKYVIEEYFMKEKEFENILARYPELIEAGLVLEGRQVAVKGKFIDLLFRDHHKERLVVELKRGTVLRKDIGQVMDYEGDLLFPDDPTVRVMLIGNRVPPSFRRSLDHHGLECPPCQYEVRHLPLTN